MRVQNNAAENNAEKNNAEKNNAEKNNAADKSNAPSVVETIVGQINNLVGDRKLARELNGFIRYQLSGLSRGIIDHEITGLGIGTQGADKFVTELATAISAVAKKTEDKDTAALLRRFAKVVETDYACVRSAALRRAAR